MVHTGVVAFKPKEDFEKMAEHVWSLLATHRGKNIIVEEVGSQKTLTVDQERTLVEMRVVLFNFCLNAAGRVLVKVLH